MCANFLRKIGFGLFLALALSLSVFSQGGKSQVTSAVVASSQSLSDQISEMVAKYPEIKPLLTTILSRQDSILAMLKEPQASLVTTLTAQSIQIGQLQTELASLTNSMEKLEKNLANERLIALNDSIKLNSAESARNISITANVAQLAYNIFATIAYFTK
jgi:hypothetical protein